MPWSGGAATRWSPPGALSCRPIQAGGGRRIVDRDPVRAREALVSIESNGRAALIDLERMVALLRGPGDGAATGSTPGLSDVPALAQPLRDGGVDVVWRALSARQQLPAALSLAIFRIVQEALTNAVKYAPAGPYGPRCDAMRA